MKLNLGCGGYPLEGFENLDRVVDGWQAQDGLPYPDGSAEAVTVSHMLMYLTEAELDALLLEVHRVLAPRGLVRITEDETADPASRRRGGHSDAVLLTSLPQMYVALQRAGFMALHVGPSDTHHHDRSLIQNLHGDPPLVFHLEGRKIRP